MKFKCAVFSFQSGTEEFSVEFIPDRVRVYSPSQDPEEFENSKKEYKPRVTDCLRLINRVKNKPAKSLNEKKRRKATKRISS